MTLSFVIPEFNIGGAGTPPLQFFRRGFILNGSGGSQPSWKDVVISGIGSLTLVNAKANGLNYLKLFGGTEQLPETYIDSVTLEGKCEQRNLPEGYTQLEYLESSGTQLIDLGLKWTYNISTKTVCEMLASGTTAFGSVGARNSASIVWGNFSSSTNANYTCFGDKVNVQFSRNMADGQFHEWEINNTGFYLDGEQKTNLSGSNQSLVSNDNIGLFGRYDGSGNIERCGQWKIKLHRTYDNNVLIQNLIPAKRNSDNVLGMYDTVTGTFFTNAGTGDFIAGSTPTPTPTNPIDIVCNNGVIKFSANLFNPADNNIVMNYIIYDTGTIAPSTNNFYTDGFIPVKPNTEYVLVGRKADNTISAYNRICWYDSSKTFISGGTYTKNIATVNTSPSNAVYARVCCSPYDSLDTITLQQVKEFNWIFQEGNSEPAYHPYGGIYYDGTVETVTDSNQLTATAQPLLSVGDYKDTQEVLSGVVNRNVGIIVLDGTENWTASSSYAGSCYWTPQGATSIAKSYVGLCTHFASTSSLSQYARGKYLQELNAINLWYGDNATTAVANLKQYLAEQYNAGTPVIVVYALYTPTTETVTGQQLNKEPVEQTSGSISNLGITVTSSSHTVPTPTQPLDIVANNGVIKASPQLLVNGNCANGITNWTVQTGIVYTDSTDYALFTNQQGNSTSYVRCNALTRVKGHKYAYIIGGKASNNITWGSRNSKQFGAMTTTDSIQAGIDEFPSDGAGYPWVAIPKNEVFYLNKNVGFRMYDLTALGLDSTITTAEQVIDYFGNKYLEPNEIYYDGTVETVTVKPNERENHFVQYINAYLRTSTRSITAYSGNSVVTFDCEVGKTYCCINRAMSGNSVLVNIGYSDTVPTTGYVYSESDFKATSIVDGYYKTTGLVFTAKKRYATFIFRYDNDSSQTPTSMLEQMIFYEVAKAQSATCQPLLSVGGYKDEQNITNGQITRNVGVKVLDGTEVMREHTNACSIPLSNADKMANVACFCTHYMGALPDTGLSGQPDKSAKAGFRANPDNDIRLYIKDTSMTSITDFQQFFADQYANGTPVIVVYPLAAPTTESVTGQPLTIQAGTNIVEITQASIDNLELEVSYKAGVEVTVEEIEAVNNDESVEVTING